MESNPAKLNARGKILEAALAVIRSKGYAATTVDELCAEAGVTKGAFFHHFESKEALAVAAAQHWSTITNALFAAAPYRRHDDPLKRLLGYVEFRKELLRGTTPEFTCLVGTMVQEAFETNPEIRKACHESIFGHSADVARDIESAKKLYAPGAKWSATSLALHIQAVLQGAFILAKADRSVKIAADSVTHLQRYLSFLFNAPTRSKPSSETLNRKRAK